jgi:hypothetical protein
VGIAYVSADCFRDSLSEIKQLLKQKAPCLREAAESTQYLRRSYPLIDVAESIYHETDRVSMHSGSSPMTAPSELDFDFDDIVVDSAAYRRVMRRYAFDLRQDRAHEGLIGGKEEIITDTNRDRAIEKNEKDGRKPERKKSQRKHHALDLLPGDAHKGVIGDKESIDISARHGPISKKERHNYEPQRSQPNMSRSQDTQIRELPTKSEFKPDIPVPWRATEIKANADVQAPWWVTPNPRKDGCQIPKQEQEDETHDNLIDSDDDVTILQAHEERVASLGAPIVEQVHLKDVSQSLSRLTSTKGIDSHGVSLTLLSSSPRDEENVRMMTEKEVVRKDQDYQSPHFTCSICSEVLGPNDTYYRHAGETSCFRHYTTNPKTLCQGCDSPVLSTPFYIDYSSRQNPWHRECFKVYSYRDIELNTRFAIEKIDDEGNDPDIDERSGAKFVTMISAVTEVTIAFQADLERLTSTIPLLMSGGDYEFAVLHTLRLLSAVEALLDALCSAPNQSFCQMRRLRKKCMCLCKMIKDCPPFDRGSFGGSRELFTSLTTISCFMERLINDI